MNYERDLEILLLLLREKLEALQVWDSLKE
jgi:hypothetical protein